MMHSLRGSRYRIARQVAFMTAAATMMMSPAIAQVQSVDPNTVIDADLAPGAPASNKAVTGAPPAGPAAPASEVPPPPPPPADPATAPAAPPASAAPATGVATASNGTTYKKDDLIGAAEGVFGKGAKGLADIIEKTLKEQGEPVAYITGREASGAIGVGLRYGSGTMTHKVEGQRDVYWTGPSLGFDLGGNAGSTFVLVYNLYDSQELYHRFPAGEGAAYFVGGFNASYLRWGKVVLIPIRVGAGMRLGANIGYMKFTEKRRWLPF
ncbi:MAG: DUF1134 domain-containing protein [Sphingobium sp.]|nr:DUF1134 domain-containing protein [Sphingobium sp.]